MNVFWQLSRICDQEVMKSMGPFKTNMNGVESPAIITMLTNMLV